MVLTADLDELEMNELQMGSCKERVEYGREGMEYGREGVECGREGVECGRERLECGREVLVGAEDTAVM